MNLTVRKATTTNAKAACNVLRRSITECCVEDHHNDPEALSAWLQNKTPENIAAWFADTGNVSIVATTAAEIVGVGLLTA